MKYFIKVYNDSYFRLYSGFQRDKGYKRLLDYNNKDKSESLRTSLSRTKKNIRELCLCNEFEYFCTWTVNSKLCDRFSLQSTQDLMHKTLKSYKRKNPSFKFIFITEKHKNGAFHFHGLIKGIGKNDIVYNKNNYPTIKHFADNLGYFSLSKINDYNKCCNYITKYITKHCIKNEHNQIYFCSRGLKKAKIEQLHNFSYNDFKKYFSDFKYKDEFCQISDFRFDELTQEQYLFFLNLR